MLTPDYSYNGSCENLEYFDIRNDIIENVLNCVKNGQSEEFDFGAKDGDGNDFLFRCLSFTTLDRFGTVRLYLAVKDLEEDNGGWHACYVLRLNDGGWILVQEFDDAMIENINRALVGIPEKTASTVEEKDFPGQDERPAKEQAAKKKTSGWKIALKIILFPFWLLWQFIKALLSLFGVALGDSPVAKGFNSGFNGDKSGYQEYTFINDMGCKQTVYSSDGKKFYSADGSYVGCSDDGGKTIK